MKLRAGEAAPQAIITCIEAAASQDFRDGMNVEGMEFGALGLKGLGFGV